MRKTRLLVAGTVLAPRTGGADLTDAGTLALGTLRENLEVALLARCTGSTQSQWAQQASGRFEWIPRDSFENTSIEIPDRQVRGAVTSSCGPLMPEAFPFQPFDAIHLCPWLRHEMPRETIRQLCRRTPVSLDLSGLFAFRQADRLAFEAPPDLLSLLPQLRWVWATFEETAALGLVGHGNPALSLHQRGAGSALVLGQEKVYWADRTGFGEQTLNGTFPWKHRHLWQAEFLPAVVTSSSLKDVMNGPVKS